MDYRIFRESSGEDENSIEAHVLARAYHAVWRCTYGSEPVGEHQVGGLQLVIDFGGQSETRADASYSRAANAARPGATFLARPGATFPARPGATSPARPGATFPARPGATSPARPGVTSSAHPGVTSTAGSEESESAATYGRREGDGRAELWERVRLFGKRMPSEELDQLIAELRALEQPKNSGSQKGAHCRNRRRDD